MKGQTNHAQADQKLYFSKTASECSLLEARKDYGQAFGTENLHN